MTESASCKEVNFLDCDCREREADILDWGLALPGLYPRLCLEWGGGRGRTWRGRRISLTVPWHGAGGDGEGEPREGGEYPWLYIDSGVEVTARVNLERGRISLTWGWGWRRGRRISLTVSWLGAGGDGGRESGEGGEYPWLLVLRAGSYGEVEPGEESEYPWLYLDLGLGVTARENLEREANILDCAGFNTSTSRSPPVCMLIQSVSFIAYNKNIAHDVIC